MLVRSVFTSAQRPSLHERKQDRLHLAPYVRSLMFTPELSGSIFPMCSSDDLVPHCGCHPGSPPGWPVYPALGKSQFYSASALRS